MAFAAVISLRQTIQRYISSYQLPILSPSRQILEFASREVDPLLHVLKRSDNRSNSSKRLNALEGQIRDAVQKLEDLLELQESNQFLSESDQSHGAKRNNQKNRKKKKKKKSEKYGRDMGRSIFTFSIDLEDARQEINSSTEMLKKLKEEYIKELANPLPEEEEDNDDAGVSSIRTDFGVKTVGLSDDLTKIKNHLLKSKRPDDWCVFSIVGMAGTGRTVVAWNVSYHLFQYFNCVAWVTVGPKYQLKEILASILAQIDRDRASNGHQLLISEGDEKNIGEHLCTRLKGRRYMIVLDDICDTHIWDLLRSSFPEQNNGSIVLLTTSLKQVAPSADSRHIFEIGVWDEETFWDFLHFIIFDNKCPLELEEAGKKIAKNCRGLIIVLAKVALFLMKAEKTVEYWNKLAADEENFIFMVADELSEKCIIENEMHRWLVDDEGKFTIRDQILRFLDFSDVIKEINMQMFPEKPFPKLEIMSFLGMVGIGKTTLVKEIFKHLSILDHFDNHVWIKIGPKYEFQEIMVDILAKIYPGIDKMDIKGNAELARDLRAWCSDKRCVIVLDDVRDIWPLEYLRRLWPDIKGVVLVTTRLAEVAQFAKCERVHKMRLLNKEESWCLFQQMVFAKELCPSELEKAGKKVVENCDGLPLLILKVADRLSRSERTPEHWNKVAEGQSSVFMDVINEISKGLLPCYKRLPQQLKTCFLYMAIFPQNYKIPISKIIKLWSAEGLIEPCGFLYEEDFAAKHLSELVDRSFVMVCQMGSNIKIKTCRLHSIFWHLSNSEAMKNKFLHSFNSNVDNLIEGTKVQSRLCIRNNILLAIKDVHNLMASFTTARSLLCTGPSHSYPVPLYYGLRFLRVLDALTIRFHEFPNEVLKLVQLRYLAITCNSKIPTSISQLWKLQYLIVNQHFDIKSSGDSLYLPLQIWDLKELKHLQIMGSSLPNPYLGSILQYLLTLLNVSAHSCTRGVLEKLIRLESLGIQIELAPDDDGKSFHYLNNVSCLSELKSLKCVVMNPELTCDFVAPPAPISMFPSSLKKLSLSGLGYPWEYMSIIGKLPKLEVLKLRCYAFRGPQWETTYGDFNGLKFLSIEDTDLVRWQIKMSSLLNLECLSIKHCYKLKELPRYLPRYFRMIEVVDSNLSVATWAEQIKEKNWIDTLSVTIQLSQGMLEHQAPAWLKR